MAFDIVSIPMVKPLLNDALVLCLGVPDMPKGYPSFRDWAYNEGAREVDAVDIIAHKGWEEIKDLNEPQQWRVGYDLVINPGTLEHCFNIGLAWRNAWDAVFLGGHLFNVFPVSLLDHGFWNMNPVALFDWCSANGGRVVQTHFAINGNAGKTVYREPIPDGRSGRGCFPPETVGYALMRKERELDFTWPTQGAYR